MNIRDTLGFFLRAAGLGALVALALLYFRPDWFGSRSPVVEIPQVREAPGAARQPGPVSYADAVQPAARAVVNVYTAKLITRRRHPLLDDPLFRYFFGDRLQVPRQRLQTSLGSGVIVSPQGYILTNNHVIAGADEIQVLLNDGRSVAATVVGVDKDTDLAVLHVDLDGLPVIPFGDSEHLRMGDVVLAIGNPFGVGQAVTLGVVSATGRHHLGINRYEDYIQTDAAINPGNSGGALINARGELIGINTAIYSRSGGSQGIGFAIPSHLATNVMKQLIEQGHVERGWLGIEAQELTPELAASFGLDDTRGLLIAGVLRDGPADRAGIQPGDVVRSIDGHPVEDARSAMNYIAQQPPGTRLTISGVREGKPFTTEAVTVKRPAALEK